MKTANAREFWLKYKSICKGINISVRSKKPSEIALANGNYIHVIEYAVVEQLEQKVKRLEKQLEVCKEQRNGWLRKYWENEKLSTEIVEVSIKEISERKDQELEKVEG
jgi:hypothetical protein